MPVASKRLTRFVEQTAPLIIADGFDIDARRRCEMSYRHFPLHQIRP
jgi:hypothetical protein